MMRSNLLDQLNLKPFLQQMSESERESATIPSDNNQTSREPFPQPKNKHIKKNKLSSPSPQPKLTKEERTKMQKEKNRQAAQRSRDQHKEYVTRLENEVKDLRAQVSANRQYCCRCRQQLDCQFFEVALKKQEILDSQMFSEMEQPEVQADVIREDIPVENDMADFFLRVKKEEEEDYSYIKMMMFLAMVVIAVLIYPTNPSGRNLVESNQFSHKQSIFPSYVDASKISIDQYRNSVQMSQKRVEKYNFSDQKCLDSLISSTSSNLRKNNQKNTSNGSLFCSFQQSSNPFHFGTQNSQQLKLFLIGADLIRSGFISNSLTGEAVQLNRIYRIQTQIRSAEAVQSHNCQLQ